VFLEEGKMKMLLDKEILAVTSPRERPEGNYSRGPWFVLHKTPTDNAIEACVLLEWQGEPDAPLERRIGNRLFTEDGPGEPESRGYPCWRIALPAAINNLPLDERLKTIAEDFLSNKGDSLSTPCLHTLSNLKQTLELAHFDTERNLCICFRLYQKMKGWTREQNEKEAREIDEKLKRIQAEANGKPDTQTLAGFLKELELDI
jgi:hypothetical protein